MFNVDTFYDFVHVLCKSTVVFEMFVENFLVP